MENRMYEENLNNKYDIGMLPPPPEYHKQYNSEAESAEWSEASQEEDQVAENFEDSLMPFRVGSIRWTGPYLIPRMPTMGLKPNERNYRSVPCPIFPWYAKCRPKLLKDEVKRAKIKKWTVTEDILLATGIEKYGLKWRQIARECFGYSRSGESCSQRWRRVIYPGISKEGWKGSEDVQLLKLFDESKPWAEVSMVLTSRNERQCHFRYLWLKLNRI